MGPGLKPGVRLGADLPSEVGAARIANTLAAHRRYGGPAVIVDFGTTTNFDVVSADGDFLGGSFAPRLEVSAPSPFSRAPRLFALAPPAPKEAIGQKPPGRPRSGPL